MKKIFAMVFMTALLICLAACGEPVTPPAIESPAAETVAPEPAPEAAFEAAPEPTPEPTPEPEPEDPLLEGPIDPAFFDDAVFFGDSVSGTLQYNADQTGNFGDALFFCEVSYSYHNELSGGIMLAYRGAPTPQADIVKQTGSAKVFLSLGINDIGTYGVEDTLRCVEEDIASIAAANPGVKIYIQSCTPVYKNGMGRSVTTSLVNDYNEALIAYCDEHGYTFIDVSSAMKDENGDLKEEYTRDQYLHLTIDTGYVWADALRDPANWSIAPRQSDMPSLG